MAAPNGLETEDVWGDAGAADLAEVADLTVEQIKNRTVMHKNNASAIKGEMRGVEQQVKEADLMIKENLEKIKLNKQLPYLVANVVEVRRMRRARATRAADRPRARARQPLKAHAPPPRAHQLLDVEPDEDEENSGITNAGERANSKACVVKGSNRQVRGWLRARAHSARPRTRAPAASRPPPFAPATQTVFLPIPGLVDIAELKPGDLVGVNKDSYLILEKLPTEFDSRVKAMELDEKPTEDYSDIGGCDKQIQVRARRAPRRAPHAAP